MNNGFTGAITVSDGTTLKATITNPATGQAFRYWTFTSSLVVVTTGTLGDITINFQSNRQAN